MCGHFPSVCCKQPDELDAHCVAPLPEFQDAAHPHTRQSVPQTHGNGQTTKAKAPSHGVETPEDAALQKVVCFG